MLFFSFNAYSDSPELKFFSNPIEIRSAIKFHKFCIDEEQELEESIPGNKADYCKMEILDIIAYCSLRWDEIDSRNVCLIENGIYRIKFVSFWGWLF